MKDEELLAAYNHLSPPIQNSDISKPILWYNENISLTLGIFADHKAAVIQTRKGTDSRHGLLTSLQYLPNIQLIIGLGFAYVQRRKSNRGDVLVSACIDGVSNFRIEDGRIKFDEGHARYTTLSTAAENVFVSRASLWKGFKCSMRADRESKARTGVLVSSPVLLNDQKALDDYSKNNERFIGGEMEGQELVQAQQYLKENKQYQVDVIVIKGVADFGDGTKDNSWQLTASLAAADYAEKKLRETCGKVYHINSKF